MGHTDTPVRRILNHAWQTFAGALPCVFVLTVVGRVGRDTVTRGLFIGDSHDVFERAAALAREVQIPLHWARHPSWPSRLYNNHHRHYCTPLRPCL